MDDLIKSMKAHLYDRVSSPLMFSFLCSWAIWNYRLLLILFSSADPEKKFAHVEALPGKSYLTHFFPAMPPEAYWLCAGFIGPLLTTLFYLLILPKFEAMALKISLEKSVKLKAIKLEAENATPIPHVESIQLRELIREAEEARDAAIERQRVLMQKEMDKKQKEIDNLQNALDAKHQEAVTEETTLQNQINTLKQAKENLENQLKETEHLVNIVFELEDGARALMTSLSNGTVSNLKELVQRDPNVQRWFGQLYSGGLVTVGPGGTSRLTKPAERLVLEQQLSQGESRPLDVAQIIAG